MTDISKFHMVAVVSNPFQYESRYCNYEIFSEDITKKGATLWTVELATGNRPHRITKTDNKRHIQVWNSSLPGELWVKENLINIAFQMVTVHAPDFRYIGWSDCDFKFEVGALEKTVDALQHWDIVQMWSHMVNLDPQGGITGAVAKSFMYCQWNDIVIENSTKYLLGGAPGGAWAFRREAINKIGCAISGPILDFAILGSGDRNMACALVGRIDESLDKRFSPNYLKWMRQYQDITDHAIKRNVGYVPNMVRHLWHGRKELRGYTSRWTILSKYQFDPETDLTKDSSGIWRLVVNTPRQMKMRDAFRKYFQRRNEDSIDLK